MINKEAHFFLLYTNEASRFKNLDKVIDGNIAYFDHGKFKCDLYNQFRPRGFTIYDLQGTSLFIFTLIENQI